MIDRPSRADFPLTLLMLSLLYDSPPLTTVVHHPWPEPFWPCLWDPRPGLTVLRLEGLDRCVDIRVHRTHGAIRLDYMVLVRIRCAVRKPRAHFVLGRDIVYPNPPGRRRPPRAIKARRDVRSDAEDTITGDWVARVSDGRWGERDHRHACNEYGRCANRWGHFSLPYCGHPDGSVCRSVLEQQQIAGNWLGGGPSTSRARRPR